MNDDNGKICKPTTPFASRGIVEHLIRGGIGIAAIIIAIKINLTWPITALALILIAVIAFRGCPMCWLTGLLDTLSTQLRSKK